MKGCISFAALATSALLLPGTVLASGPFEGTWKMQPGSFQFSSAPDQYELKDGVFRCASCAPAYLVKADGSDQKVSGQGYFDSVAVKVIDARTVELTDKLGGKTMYVDTRSVSADGAILTDAFEDRTGAKLVTWTQTAKRVGPAPTGAHATSGSWKADAVPQASDSAVIVSYRMSSDGLQMNYNGATYDAKFDGKPVPIVNDPGKTWVSLRRIADSVIEETDTRDGKKTDVTLMTIAPDGNTMTVVDKDLQRDATTTWILKRQP